ncbi:unnamed protein product [Trichobilharzia regenti]|nr:unnamed protein product [Trichobilharzia regenti]
MYTDLMLSVDSNTNLLLDEHLMLKEHASLSKIQQNLLFVAELINHDLPELSEPPRTKLKWADLLRSQVKELFVRGYFCSKNVALSIDQMSVGKQYVEITVEAIFIHYGRRYLLDQVVLKHNLQ